MIEALLPSPVASADTVGELDEPLFAVEEAAVARVAPIRHREFRSVRGCARLALARLGFPRPPMVPGERGAPTWPPGIVGSMTHCPGYRAAAVARDTELAGLGIDAEEDAPLPEGVLELVTLPGERERLASLARHHPDLPWGRLVFSAKESVYKAWFPLARCWLAFEDVDVTFDERGAFRADVVGGELAPGARPFASVHGRWLVAGGLVVTAVTVPITG
ncbi:MAG: 4'-phosphopantetheinyl transferase superfamily protein [Kineosporiaceae bacterium]